MKFNISRKTLSSKIFQVFKFKCTIIFINFNYTTFDFNLMDIWEFFN